ncbi:hypothetical protein BBK82_03130 [Lentzea guizhouensis]|uniref:Uncharacterized protein n=1 Tax=Lentzea guizhouensis TaxID=1586287 RepID=A0A1B2HBV8_9PSEU|nr:hypothetical protein [Lentzea guizhouensis]ANZ35210.1 hypothetical protein BBK82_03130 [Lentzea guizhouensis]
MKDVFLSELGDEVPCEHPHCEYVLKVTEPPDGTALDQHISDKLRVQHNSWLGHCPMWPTGIEPETAVAGARMAWAMDRRGYLPRVHTGVWVPHTRGWLTLILLNEVESATEGELAEMVRHEVDAPRSGDPVRLAMALDADLNRGKGGDVKGTLISFGQGRPNQWAKCAQWERREGRSRWTITGQGRAAIEALSSIDLNGTEPGPRNIAASYYATTQAEMLASLRADAQATLKDS